MTKSKSLQRETKFDKLRTVAIIMILISHSLPKYGSYNMPYRLSVNENFSDVQHFIFVFLNYFGQIGNGIFIATAAWFLLDKGKINIFKVVKMIVDTIVISLLFLIVFIFCGVSLTTKEVLRSFVPITSGSLWFIGCYILLYCIHPWINIIIQSMSKVKLKVTVGIMFCLYCIIQFIIPGAYYYTNFIGFVILYFFVAFIKKSDFKENLSKLKVVLIIVGALFCHTMLLVLTNVMGNHLSIFANQMNRWNMIVNPFICIISVFSVVGINKYGKNNSNKWTRFSTNSLLIYIFSENDLLRNHLKPFLWSTIYNKISYTFLIFEIMFFFILLCIFSNAMANVYNVSIEKLTNKLSRFISDRIVYHLVLNDNEQK